MPDPRAQQFAEIPELPPLVLPTHPPARSTLPLDSRMTRERLDGLLATIEPGFLSEEEVDLLAFVVVSYSRAFAWEYEEKGFFDPQYFPDYKIPYIEHTPWQVPPIPLPPALRQAVRDEVRRFEDLGRFEPSTSSYRSPLWWVEKKPGSKPPIRLVIAVEMLNSVAVRDASLPPNINDFAESFVGYSIYMAADMFSGFDARILDVSSRPLGTFHSPDGPKQQTTLIQGYTNSIQEFSRCTDHVLRRLKARDWADNFVDDSSVKGPRSRYNDEPIPGNLHIRRFVFEFAERIVAFLAALIAGGITISALKTVLACSRLKIVGSLVSLEGWQVGSGLVEKVLRWPVPESISEVRMFLGLAGGARRWIKNYARIAWPLTTLLSRPADEFAITPEVEEAVTELKRLLTSAPVLVRIDYEKATLITRPPRDSDDGMLVVGVDSSWMGAGWVLYQIVDGIKRVALYGSSTFTKPQQNYGQPKSEVFGTFVALKALRHRVWGVHFRLENDASSLATMLRKPDDVPNAPMLRWVSWLLLFDFEIKHVPAASMKMEDALSRAPQIDTGLSDPSEDVDEFLEAYDLHAAVPRTGRSPAMFSSARSMLRSLQLTHSNPFAVSSQYAPFMTTYSASTALAFHSGERFNPSAPSLLSSAPASLLALCTVIFSTAYHPEGNAPVERSHNTLTTSLFKVTGDAKGRWPLYLAPVLFAMRTTVSRATGFSPYYLLYGQYPVFSYDVEEVTWQTLNWDEVHSHEDLVAMRARQIQRRDINLEKAHDRLRASRKKAIDDYARRHHHKFDFADYEEGMYVWLRESKLDEIKGGKGEWTYAGPYVIHEKRGRDSFILRELSGAVLKGHVNIRRLRLFFFRPDNQTLRARIRTPPEHDARRTNPLSTLAAVYAYRAAHGPS
ncbi:hypothetical protein GSI_06871 [Ganoderma sinense ZZ0214-1]|uniref:Reverse transcriptase RNase H-like domain-containing protein n=1 Tax=Ganoderma sinense ZZ0214-1 TaxID=1077348 RepID=A0A2G8SAC3_9APHY|nr:hypothetical protein GSI_06871 [Ganoderma sinense ZZ0214-1]